MKKLCKSYCLIAGLLLGSLFMAILGVHVHAEEKPVKELIFNGETVYDTEMRISELDKLPEGVSYNPDTSTLTFNNANVQAISNEAFVRAITDFNSDNPAPFHVQFLGNNTITRPSGNELDNRNNELFYCTGSTIVDGSGTLTLKNILGHFFNQYYSSCDLTIRDCTINCPQNGNYIFCVGNLTLDGCVLNTDYNTATGKKWDDWTGSSAMTDLVGDGHLIMKNATWNVNTSGSAADSTMDYLHMSAGGGAEFHNSLFNVTGDCFGAIGFDLGDVILDNATFLGTGYFSGCNYDSTGNNRYTYYNFVNRHAQRFEGQYIKEYSGRYCEKDFFSPISFDIVPYSGPAINPNGGSSSPSGPAINPNGGSSSPSGPATDPSGNGGSSPASAKLVTSLTITAPSKKIAAGKEVQLTADVYPADAANKEISWSSSNTKVATVSSSGKVKILKKTGGKKVTITARATDGSGATASIDIKSMKGVVKKIKIKGSKSVKAGKSIKLKAVVTASKGANKSLSWTSSNKKYATVNKNGKVKALKAGKGKTVKITAAALDGSGKKAKIKIKIK